MKNARTLTAAFAVGLTLICITPSVRADEWDKKTTITINEAVQLPTVVLQPGTYVMKLMNSQSDRHIVQVFDKDQQLLITTILAIPNYRVQRTGKSEFTFWEVPAGQPRALRAWFYPGDNFGQEFAYPKELSTQISAYTKTSVPTTEVSASDLAKVETSEPAKTSGPLETRTFAQSEPPPPVRTPAPVVAQQERPQPVELAQAIPAPAPPAPQPSATPSELPKTASVLPLVGFIGLVSLAGFGLMLVGKRAR